MSSSKKVRTLPEGKAAPPTGAGPQGPETGYGYIEAEHPHSPGVLSVTRFVEKPKLEVARQYVASGKHYWNSGIFVWKAKTILAALAKYEPEMHQRLQAIATAIALSLSGRSTIT